MVAMMKKVIMNKEQKNPKTSSGQGKEQRNEILPHRQWSQLFEKVSKSYSVEGLETS
jgi:hypothetical protein